MFWLYRHERSPTATVFMKCRSGHRPITSSDPRPVGCPSPQAVHHDSSVRHQVGRLSLRAERNAARAAMLRVERGMPLHLAAKTWRVWQRRPIFSQPLTAAGLSGCAPRSSLLQFRLIRARCMLACIALGLCCCALCFIYLFICCGYRGRAVRMERFSRQSRSH